MPKISDYHTYYFLRYAHVSFVRNIQKQQNMLKLVYLLRNLEISHLNNARNLRIKNAKFSGRSLHT